MWYFFICIARGAQVDPALCVDLCSHNGECHEITKILPYENNTQPHYYLCRCYEGFTGISCGECEHQRFGPSCSECPKNNNATCSGNGICDMGIKSSGKCQCFSGFDPATDCSEENNFLEYWDKESKLLALLLLSLAFCIILMQIIQKMPKQFLPSTAGAIFFGIVLGIVFKKKYPDKTLEKALSFNPGTFFLLILPPIIFEAGYSLEKKQFFSNIGTIFVFALPGTILSSLIFGGLLYFLCKNLELYSFSLLDCMLFGSLTSALDPIATLKIFEAMKLEKNLRSIVLGESVVNDAVAIAIFRILSSYSSIEENWAYALFDLLIVLPGSAIIGLCFGFLSALLFKYVNFRTESSIELAMFSLLSYLSFTFCEALNLSGILCLLFVGMSMSHYTKSWLSPEVEEAVFSGLTIFAYISETFCFVYLGISIALSSSNLVVSVVVTSVLLMLFSRGVVVFCASFVCNKFRKDKISLTHQFVIWLSGLRGAVAFTLALSFPSKDPDVIISTTQYMILFTFLSLSFGVYPVLKELKYIKELKPIVRESTRLAPEELVGIQAESGFFEKLDSKYLQKCFAKQNLIE